MKRSRLVLLILGVAIAGGITWKSMQPAPPTLVVTATAEKVDLLRAVVSATGEIRAKEFVDIQAEVTGVIVELRVREGDTVKQGDVLLRLEDLQLRAEEDSARAQVGAGEADVRSAEVGVATAEANLASERTTLVNARIEVEQAKTSRDRAGALLKRKRELFEQQLIGDEEFEVAVADARLAEQRLEFNEARIQQIEANLHAAATRVDAATSAKASVCRRLDATKAALARATDMVGKTVLKAPLSGLITALHVEKGERAVPGFQSNPIATLMTIADMSVIEAEIRVDEADIVAVQLGAPAEVEVDAIRDVKFAGAVTEIGQSPIQTPGNGGGGGGQNEEGKEFKVVVRLHEPPATLRPGFTATADIVTATRTDCLVVPLQALTAREVEVDPTGAYVPPPQPSGDELPQVTAAPRRQHKKEIEGVFLRTDGRARFRPVKTGITGDMDIEVLDGLQPGDEVVTGPYQAMRSLKEWDRIDLDPKRAGDLVAKRRR